MARKKLSLSVLFVLLGIHLTLPLTINGAVLVPEILVFPFLLLAGYVYRAAINKKIVSVLAGVAVLAMLTVLLSPIWAEYYVAHLRSSVNLITSLLIAYALIVFLCRKDLELDLSFNLKAFVFVALVLSVLEIAVPDFTAVVDSFRNAVFPTDRIYTAEWRDINLFGAKRPTFFGNEPSYLGITLSTFAVCISLLKGDLRNQLMAAFLLFASVLIVRSPTALAIALIVPVVFLSDAMHGRLKRWQAIVLLQLPILILSVSFLVMNVFGARIDQVLAGEDNSSDIRLRKPAEALFHSLHDSPLVGMGVGGRDKLTPTMLVKSDWSGHTGYVFDSDRFSDFFSTGTFLIFSETGLVALAILLAIFLGFRALLPRITLFDFLLCFSLVSVTMGGWTHPRLWLLIGLLLFAFHCKRSSRELSQFSQPSLLHRSAS